MKKIIIGILATLGLAVVLLNLLVAIKPDCKHILKSAATSSDDRYTVSVYRLECEGKPARIEVRLSGSDQLNGRIIFSAEPKQTENIEVEWVNQKKILITYPFSLTPEHISKNNLSSDVYIEYKYQ
jgi:hypothetical protein